MCIYCIYNLLLTLHPGSAWNTILRTPPPTPRSPWHTIPPPHPRGHQGVLSFSSATTHCLSVKYVHTVQYILHRRAITGARSPGGGGGRPPPFCCQSYAVLLYVPHTFCHPLHDIHYTDKIYLSLYRKLSKNYLR
jgi:hypothetical protein